MKKTRKLLEEEISLRLKKLDMLDDVDQRRAAIDEVTKLLDWEMQLQKLEDGSRSIFGVNTVSAIIDTVEVLATAGLTLFVTLKMFKS